MKKAFVLGTAHWNTPIPTNQHHVVSYLSTILGVTYSESIKLRRPALTSSEIRRIVKRIKDSQSGEGFIRSVPQGLKIISPTAVPFHGKFGRAVNGVLLKSDFGKAIQNADLFWTYTPTTYNLELDCQASVYHCVDLYSAIKGVSPKVVNDMEKRLASRGVVAIGSSMPVVDHLKAQGFNRVEFWPNVADVEVFKQARASESTERSGVIFAGHLTSEKLDSKAMLNIARACQARGQKFTLVGPLNVGSGDFRDTLSALLALGTTYLGSLPLEQVAQECKKHLVGVIPYSDNEYNYGVSPLKLYEYLAAGLSVVSAGLPSIQGVHDAYALDLKIAETESFGDAVSAELDRFVSSIDLERRLHVADANSWTKRHEEINSLLQDLRVL